MLLNPRQFAALSELGDMLQDYGDKAGALKLYRRALDLDPQLDGAEPKGARTDPERGRPRYLIPCAGGLRA